MTYKDYFRGFLSIIWLMLIYQVLIHIINGASVIITLLYFIIGTCSIGMACISVDNYNKEL